MTENVIALPDQSLVGPDGQPIKSKKVGNLIGLLGKAGAGKDVIATHLSERHEHLVGKFAAPLKAMVTTLLVYAGTDKHQIKYWLEGEGKEKEHPALGASPRHLMQTLGTEWGRKAVRDSFWVDLAMNAVQHARDAGIDVVMSDVRFPNEVEAIQKAGGFILYINRPTNKGLGGDQQAHESEAHIETLGAQADEVILNDSDLFDLRRKVDRRHKNWRK